MGLLRRVHGVTLRHKVRNSEIHKAVNVEPLLRTERSQLRLFGHVSSMPQQKSARQILLATPTRSGSEVVQGPGDVIFSLTLLGPVLALSQQNYQRLQLTVRYFKSSLCCCPRYPLGGNVCMKINNVIEDYYHC